MPRETLFSDSAIELGEELREVRKCEHLYVGRSTYIELSDVFNGYTITLINEPKNICRSIGFVDLFYEGQINVCLDNPYMDNNLLVAKIDL